MYPYSLKAEQLRQGIGAADTKYLPRAISFVLREKGKPNVEEKGEVIYFFFVHKTTV